MNKREASYSVNKPPHGDDDYEAEVVPKRQCTSHRNLFRHTSLSVEAPTVAQMMSMNMHSTRLSLDINLVPALCGWSCDWLQYKFPPVAPIPAMPFIPQNNFPTQNVPTSPVSPFGFINPDPPVEAPIPHNYPIMVPSPMKIAQEALGAPTDPVEDYYWNLFLARGDILPSYQTKFKGLILDEAGPSGTKAPELKTVKIEPLSPAPVPDGFIGDNVVGEAFGDEHDPTKPSWFDHDLTIGSPS